MLIISMIGITDFNCKMNMSALLAKDIIEYLDSKKKVYDWPSDSIAQSGMKGMLAKKSEMR